MKKPALVIIPMPAIGHIVSSTEFARRLLSQNDGIMVTILLMRVPFALEVDAYAQSLVASDSIIQFIRLPQVDPPPIKEALKSSERFTSIFIESHRSHFKNVITKIVLSDELVSLVGLVVDLLCTSMIDVANELRVPSYIFFTSGAAFLGFMLYLPTRHDQVGSEFQETDSDSIIPSHVNSVPASVLPLFVFNKEGGYTSLLNQARRYKETKGIIVNTFAELERQAVGSFLSDDMPPVYTVGPLIDLNGQNRSELNGTQRDEIMNWLDNQPPHSVLFLCFGSVGSLHENQLKEIAVGLQNSGHRFLWSVRRSPPKGVAALPSDYIEFEHIFPEGFLEKTKEKGLICRRTPQVEVLAHRAIGGFVSHCGWNSILESLWYGVPIVTWPMYAEQQINAFQLVKDLGLAVELKLDYKKDVSDLVVAEEIEKAIKIVMDSENEVRKRVKETSDISRKAVEGGSSLVAFQNLIELMLENKT